MAIKTYEGGTVVTGNHIEVVRLMALKAALKLEIKGIKMSRGASAFSIVRKSLGFKGTKIVVLAQLEKYIEEMKVAVSQAETATIQ